MNVVSVLMSISRMFIYLAILIAVILAGILVSILLNSSGKPRPFKDAGGRVIASSISEKGEISIGDTKLGFFVKGEDISNPVLLYLHGGMPDYFLTEKYPTGLDSIFTVVWLDQRGAGLSFDPDNDNKNITIDRMIEDIREVTGYLTERFSQDRIYLMAHSGGTYLGIKVIESHPELYKAYIGVAQISYQKLSEKMASEYIMEEYKDNPKRKKVYEKLAGSPIDLQQPIPGDYVRYRDYAMHDLGVGTIRSMKNVITGIFFPSLYFNEYNLQDKLNLWRGKAGSGISIMWDEIINNDLSRQNTSFEVPVYFFHGIYDYTCSYELAKDYFDKIDAPEKAFFTFSNSAHSPIFEEPSECISIIRSEILKKGL